MIQDFPNPALLPGGYRSGPPSDLSTYRNLWKVAENLVEQCVKRRGQMGWQPTGTDQNPSPLLVTLRTSLLQRFHGCWSPCLVVKSIRSHG